MSGGQADRYFLSHTVTAAVAWVGGRERDTKKDRTARLKGRCSEREKAVETAIERHAREKMSGMCM